MTDTPRSGALRWNVGPVEIQRIEERISPVPWDLLVPGGAEHVEACRPWIDPFVSGSGRYLLLSVHSFVVRTPKTMIVVDTCVGPSDKFELEGDADFSGRLAVALPGGFDAVDVVVCTHLHFDHIGWNTFEVDGVHVPRFPNARYLVNDTELASGRNGRMGDEQDEAAWAASIQPLLDRDLLDAVDDHHQVDPWVTLEPSPGHTPGHTSVRVSDGDNTALITGDMFHTPLQFPHPDASSLPDADKDQAIATRHRYIDELTNRDVLVLGTHFAPPTAGRLVLVDEAVRFEPHKA